MCRVWVTLPLLWLGACGTASQGITYIGIPVDTCATTAYIRAYAAYAGAPDPNTLWGTVEVKRLDDFGPLGPYPNTQLGSGGGGEGFYITVDGPEPGFDWHDTALAHELTHVIWGDPEHAREDLWGDRGLVTTWNGWQEGHNPAVLSHGR